MKTILYVLIVSLFFFNSCKKVTSNEESNDFTQFITFSDFGNAINISGEEIIFDDIIYNPFDLILMDSLIIINDVNADFEYNIYNINNKKRIGGYFRRGNGPNEFLTNQFVNSFNSNLWIWDHDRQTIYEYLLNDIFSKTKDLEPINKISPSEYSMDPMILSKDTVVSVRPFDANHKFSYLDVKGDLVKTIGEYPIHKKTLTVGEITQGFTFKYISKIESLSLISMHQ